MFPFTRNLFLLALGLTLSSVICAEDIHTQDQPSASQETETQQDKQSNPPLSQEQIAKLHNTLGPNAATNLAEIQNQLKAFENVPNNAKGFDEMQKALSEIGKLIPDEKNSEVLLKNLGEVFGKDFQGLEALSKVRDMKIGDLDKARLDKSATSEERAAAQSEFERRVDILKNALGSSQFAFKVGDRYTASVFLQLLDKYGTAAEAFGNAPADPATARAFAAAGADLSRVYGISEKTTMQSVAGLRESLPAADASSVKALEQATMYHAFGDVDFVPSEIAAQNQVNRSVYPVAGARDTYKTANFSFGPEVPVILEGKALDNNGAMALFKAQAEKAGSAVIEVNNKEELLSKLSELQEQGVKNIIYGGHGKTNGTEFTNGTGIINIGNASEIGKALSGFDGVQLGVCGGGACPAFDHVASAAGPGTTIVGNTGSLTIGPNFPASASGGTSWVAKTGSSTPPPFEASAAVTTDSAETLQTVAKEVLPQTLTATPTPQLPATVAPRTPAATANPVPSVPSFVVPPSPAPPLIATPASTDSPPPILPSSSTPAPVQQPAPLVIPPTSPPTIANPSVAATNLPVTRTPIQTQGQMMSGEGSQNNNAASQGVQNKSGAATGAGAAGSGNASSSSVNSSSSDSGGNSSASVLNPVFSASSSLDLPPPPPEANLASAISSTISALTQGSGQSNNLRFTPVFPDFTPAQDASSSRDDAFSALPQQRLMQNLR